MAKVIIDIDDKLLDDTTKKEMKRLKRKISSLETINNKLRDKLDDQKSRVEAANTVIDATKNMVENFSDYKCLMEDFETKGSEY